MKKAAILALAAGAVFASAHGDKTPKSISCAVETGNKVDVATATKNHMYADYKGKRYFFCCEGCPAAFKADPAKYAKNASIPTPKTTKKS